MGSGFKALSACLIDAWVETPAGAMPDAGMLHGRIGPDLRPNMMLATIDTREPDPRDFHISFVKRYSLVTQLFCIATVLRDQRMGDFVDQDYLERSVFPAYCKAVDSVHPVIDLVTTSVLGMNVVYDRIVLPQKVGHGRPGWCLMLSETRLLMSPPPLVPERDPLDDTIVQLLTEGMTAKEIAARTGSSPRTVEHRIDRLKTRYGARNLPHLVALAMSDSFQHMLDA